MQKAEKNNYQNNIRTPDNFYIFKYSSLKENSRSVREGIRDNKGNTLKK
jgi:hypothetical protein